MSIYKVCPKCGAHLDPGERCSCESIEEILLNQLTIEMERTNEFHQAIGKLGDYMKSLPLTQPENDRLIQLFVDQINAAERGAFIQGFNLAKEFAKDERDRRRPQ